MAVDGTKHMSTAKRTYLVGYNALSAALWSVVLYRTALVLTTEGPGQVYPAVGEWTKWTQTLAGLEVVHSVLGAFSHPSPSSPNLGAVFFL